MSKISNHNTLPKFHKVSCSGPLSKHWVRKDHSEKLDKGEGMTAERHDSLSEVEQQDGDRANQLDVSNQAHGEQNSEQEFVKQAFENALVKEREASAWRSNGFEADQTLSVVALGPENIAETHYTDGDRGSLFNLAFSHTSLELEDTICTTSTSRNLPECKFPSPLYRVAVQRLVSKMWSKVELQGTAGLYSAQDKDVHQHNRPKLANTFVVLRGGSDSPEGSDSEEPRRNRTRDTSAQTGNAVNGVNEVNGANQLNGVNHANGVNLLDAINRANRANLVNGVDSSTPSTETDSPRDETGPQNNAIGGRNQNENGYSWASHDRTRMVHGFPDTTTGAGRWSPQPIQARVDSPARSVASDDWVIDWWLTEPLGRTATNESYSPSVDSVIAQRFFRRVPSSDEHRYNPWIGYGGSDENGPTLFPHWTNSPLSRVPYLDPGPASNIWPPNPGSPDLSHRYAGLPESPSRYMVYPDPASTNPGFATGPPANVEVTDAPPVGARRRRDRIRAALRGTWRRVNDMGTGVRSYISRRR